MTAGEMDTSIGDYESVAPSEPRMWGFGLWYGFGQ